MSKVNFKIGDWVEAYYSDAIGKYEGLAVIGTVEEIQNRSPGPIKLNVIYKIKNIFNPSSIYWREFEEGNTTWGINNILPFKKSYQKVL